MSFRVLIVDDEPSICDLLELAFGRIEAEVVTAGSGEEGLERFRAGGRFDAALVDKNLPRMSGLEVLRALREADPGIALLMITGFYSAETAEEALNIDVDAYVEKPFRQLAALVEKTVEAAAKRRARRPPPRTGPPRIAAVADASVRSVLAESVPPPNEIVTTGTEEELKRQLEAAAADVIVIDASLFGDRVAGVVERALALSPGAEVVVLSGQVVPLPVVERLIELGVRKLVRHTGYTRPILEAIAKSRARSG